MGVISADVEFSQAFQKLKIFGVKFYSVVTDVKLSKLG